MDKGTKVTLIKHLDVTDMAGDKVMIDFDTGKYFMLRGTAVDIWDNIQSETTVGDVLNTMLDIYDVDENTCLEGIEKFLKQLEEAKFIELA
ncbi:PqqD family peptide modification chaperone [Butyrivibrio sp. JL13D10]|uniref:PqqD family peptide modification chaperone n=1 Tax=Butyrivibrio sp. JL13D10 TaxID=3236815 RepID=UPI0038B67F34